MIRKSVEVLFFGGTVPIGFVFLYFLSRAFSHPSDDDLIRYITILIFLVILFAILLVLFIFRNSLVKSPQKGRVLGLIGKRIYSVGGDYFGTVNEVLLGQNSLYGLRALTRKKKKVVLLSKAVRQYGDVVLVDSRVIED